MTKTLRVGVIGLGVGEAHLASYQSLPEVEVAAICDIDPARLDEIGDRYDVAARHLDWRRIAEDPNIDAVSICSFDDAHADQAEMSLRNGKHCMIEKPVALNRADAERILRAQSDNDRIISTNLILRHSPRFQELRQRITAGEFGEVFHGEADYLHEILWKLTSGWRGKMPFYCVTYGGGIHLIDLFRWVTGREVVEVCGMGTNLLTQDSSYKYDDTTSHVLRLDNGGLFRSATSLGPQRPKFHALSVYGSRKTFVNGRPDAVIYDSDDEADRETVKTPYDPNVGKGGLLADFVNAIRTGTQPNVNARDVFRVMDICFACYDAAQSGKTVKVDYQI